MARTSIWLVRHGQTEWNKQRRYLGAAESPLTPYGLLQHAALARRLRALPFTRALASPRQRTLAAAEAVLAERDLASSPDPRWREVDHGRWEGLTYREVLARYPLEARARFADALQGRALGGESLAEAAARVAEGWAALLRDHAEERVLLATHATPIQLVLCLLTGMPAAEHWRWRIDLGSITAVDVYGPSAIVRTVNLVPPLPRAGGAP
jgi:alpha-ribazole phosphatase